MLFIQSLYLSLHDPAEGNMTYCLATELRMIKAQGHQLRADRTSTNVGGFSLARSRMINNSLHLETSGSGTCCSFSTSIIKIKEYGRLQSWRLTNDDLENDAATAVKSEPLPSGDSNEDNPTDVASDLSKLELSEAGASQSSKKPNRQKARLARRAAEQARLAEEAEAEAADMPDLGAREKEIMADTFKKHALHEKEIRADGHCLYSAVADQLRTKGRDIKLEMFLETTMISESCGM